MGNRKAALLALGLAMAAAASAPPPRRAGASTAGSVPGAPGGRGGASGAVPFMTAEARSMLRVADDLGTRLDLIVPLGAARVVIQTSSDSLDEDLGWVVAYDPQGREVLRQRETTGIALHLAERSALLARLAERAGAPIEVRLPPGTARVRLVSQNYDRDANPMRDGRALAYDSTGQVLADELGLALDVLAP
jgi:hypothetical protein